MSTCMTEELRAHLSDIMTLWQESIFRVTDPFVRKIHRSSVDSPHNGTVTQSFEVSFYEHLNKLLNKEMSCR